MKAHSVPSIGLFLQGVRHYEREILRGISDFANLHGPWDFFRAVPYLSGETTDPAALITRWKPDAVILRESSPRCFDALRPLSLPTLYSPTTECWDEVSNIVVNDQRAGEMAARHLHEAGFRNFGYCGLHGFFWSRLRGQGFAGQLEAAGHPVETFESHHGREFFSWDPSHVRLTDWLLALPKPVGVFSCTDDFSLLVQEACLSVGLRVPDDVALIGVGNDESICDLARVSQSSVRLNIRRGGFEAASHLAAMLDRPDLPRQDVIIEPLEVVTRGSTDAAETHDPEVAKAITFIRERVKQPLEVEDIVRQVSLSRRGLYDRFRAATGKSISAYIRDRRLEKFARLLLETNLTVSEIAYAMGYESGSNVARLFKAHFGLTPVAYRRKHQ